MDIAEIARRTKIKPERLRYVLDRGAVPNGSRFGQGRGSARDLPDNEAFVVAAAAKLIDGGVRKPFARGFIRGMTAGHAPQWTKIREDMLQKDSVAVMEVGDGVYIRVRQANKAEAPKWVRLRDRQPAPEGYVPVVVVSVDMAALAKELWA